MNKLKDKIFIAGHKGLVGSSILSLMKKKNYKNIIVASRKKLDLTNQRKVDFFFKKNRIDILIIAAAKVGGIKDNQDNGANFLLENLQIQNNLICSAHKYKIKKILFLGSSCIYPSNILTKINEKHILTSRLEKTNEAYAIAKIAGLKLCEFYNKKYKTDFRCLMPTNLYGPNDKFDINLSHVIPALLIKFHNAKIHKHNKVKIWGNGKAEREFLFVDDLARAILHILSLSKNKYQKIIDPNYQFINVGFGKDITITKLAHLIKKITKYDGKIIYENKMPNGTQKKLLDSSLINKTGWQPKTNLENGLKLTYEWYCKSIL